MICRPCAIGHHWQCPEAGKDYRGCACQHVTRQPDTGGYDVLIWPVGQPSWATSNGQATANEDSP